jgi:protease-4
VIDHGPFTAKHALASGLITRIVDTSDVADRPEPAPAAKPIRLGPSGQIGVVVIDGSIIDGESVDVPLIGTHMSGSRTLEQSLDELAENSRIRAIVLRIDSPGGAVMASDQLWRAVRRASRVKPVIASLGEVAASGGYYIASAASEVYAAPSTTTGSIGIFYGKVDLEQLAMKVGIRVETDSRGARAGAESLFRPFSDSEREALQATLQQWYSTFVERVADGRKLSRERVDELGQGRVYSGQRALELKLIDGLGGLEGALARAGVLAGLDENAEFVVVPEKPWNFINYVLSSGGAKASEASVPAAFSRVLRVAAPMLQASSLAPMALYEGSWER